MSIGDTIRTIVRQAESEGADPVSWVRDYLEEKSDRMVSRTRAASMIARHKEMAVQGASDAGQNPTQTE
jgi:hypothetical protein